jgi:hypothetical protein
MIYYILPSGDANFNSGKKDENPRSNPQTCDHFICKNGFI